MNNNKLFPSFNQAKEEVFNQVCAYACPPTEYIPNIFITQDPIIKNTNYIDYYKEKFKELVIEMEEKYGKCTSVNITHQDIDSPLEQITVSINF